MHEFSIMAGVIEAALNSISSYDVENVEKVYLDIGELTFLSPEQLRFAFEILSKNNALEGAELVLEERRAEVKCLSCDYCGRPGNGIEGEQGHFGFFSFYCPKCGGAVDIIRGKECVLKRIKMNLKDENTTGQVNHN